MITEKIIINGIHYIRETFDNGTINTYVDPDFQPVYVPQPKPPLPNLTTLGQMLHFIIKELRLKDRYQP